MPQQAGSCLSSQTLGLRSHSINTLAPMNTSDYIAVVAILVAFLSAYYTRQARDAARNANKIAISEGRRPLRLAVYTVPRIEDDFWRDAICGFDSRVD